MFDSVLRGLSDGRVLSPAPAYRYPFYAVQWHPEKSPFEWVDKPGMVHLGSAVRASFYTASFFISEGEKQGGREGGGSWGGRDGGRLGGGEVEMETGD